MFSVKIGIGSELPVEVLLVEDSTTDALITTACLQNDPGLDVRITRAIRLAEAIDLVRQRSFDIGVVDLNLPDSDGPATFERLHAAAPDLPMIVLTGMDNRQVEERLLHAGSQDVLNKARMDGHFLARFVRHAAKSHRMHREVERIAQQIRESERDFRNIINSNADAMVIVDSGGLLQFVNPAAEEMFGRSVEDLSGQPFGFPVAEARRKEATEIEFVHLNGTTGIAEMRVVDITWNDSPAHLATLHDITARARTATELKVALSRLRAVLDNPSMFLWAIDVSGMVTESEGRLLDDPNIGERVSVGRSIQDIYRSNRKILELSQRALQGETFHEQVELDKLTVEMWWTPLLDDAGQFSGTICVGVDVSERVRLEAHLQQAQKMEAIGRLAGGVAHDFNNLLMVIGSFATLVAERLQDQPDILEDVEQIQQATQSASSLTSQLLAFSRRQIVQPQMLDLSVEVARIELMLRRLIGENIHLATNLRDDLDPVKADPGQIEQIVMNLVVNARDAMPQGGRLTIESANEELDEAFMASRPEAVPGRYVRLTVTDTGVGMDEEARRSIFEPFFTTKELGNGTGLGLATVYGIVRQNGGLIVLDSEPRQGASFKIYLPAMADKVPARTVAREDQYSLAGTETILVVEDQPAVLDVMRRMLSLQGYRVLAASGGLEATKISAEHFGAIDLVLSDLVMPDISGRELVHALLAERPAMRAVYMSGHTDDTAARLGISDSGVAFLQKPFSLKALLMKVRETLDSALDTPQPL